MLLDDLMGQTIEYTGDAWSPTLKNNVKLTRVKVDVVDIVDDNYGQGYIVCETGADEDDELKWFVLDPGFVYDVFDVEGHLMPYVTGICSDINDRRLDAEEWLEALLGRVLEGRAH